MKLVNSFSLNMLEQLPCNLRIEEVFEATKIVKCVKVENCIGHADTDRIVRRILGNCIPPGKRETIQVALNETVLLAQYIGQRLPEGATELPEGAEIRFFAVTPYMPFEDWTEEVA